MKALALKVPLSTDGSPALAPASVMLRSVGGSLTPTTTRTSSRRALTLVSCTRPTNHSNARPHTRADCAEGPRPCPWLTCRYHLADIARNGQPLGETCSLDVADRGDSTLDEIGKILGVTRERIRQIEAAALAKLRRRELGE